MKEKKMSYFKQMTILRKLTKHMKKNDDLRKYMDGWLEKTFNTKNENELMLQLQQKPENIMIIISHYKEIKDKY